MPPRQSTGDAGWEGFAEECEVHAGGGGALVSTGEGNDGSKPWYKCAIHGALSSLSP
ncbi:hypothetical protein T484DRAFT_1846103 [Baffinella frigidus]|nr:hypothetical protein T484DRAFT_1846103 [Cryptophyta sp. CCMP2293]